MTIVAPYISSLISPRLIEGKVSWVSICDDRDVAVGRSVDILLLLSLMMDEISQVRSVFQGNEKYMASSVTDRYEWQE